MCFEAHVQAHVKNLAANAVRFLMCLNILSKRAVIDLILIKDISILININKAADLLSNIKSLLLRDNRIDLR